MDSIQICHVVVTGFQGVTYLKVILNSRIKKLYFLVFFCIYIYTQRNISKYYMTQSAF